MNIFSIGKDSRPVKVWGPTASVSVSISALGSIVGDDWVLEGVQIGAKEIVDVRQCFNDVSYIYALGNDQGNCSIVLSFVVFIGTKNCVGGDNMAAIELGLSKYKNSRISRNTTPTTISIGGFSTRGWLTGLSIGNLDAEKGICHAVSTFIMQLEA